MTYLARNHILTGFVLVLLVLTGCDAVDVATVDLDADRIAEIDQATNEALEEVGQLTKTYDDILLNARKADNFVYVPAGSNDALAGALAAAGSGGVVVLASGLHHESGTVAITQKVLIIGAPGAKLVVDTQPMPSVATVDPALHIMDASHVVIWGLEILPQGDVGGTAILAERASHLVVGRTRVNEHQNGVVIDRADHARIIHNTLALAPGTPAARGIIVINGAHAMLVSNTVSNATVGIFLSDRKGRLIRNEMFDSFLGLLLCNVHQLPAPSGEILSADISATEWVVSHNNAHDNAWGYLVFDGANKNLLARTNEASNNSNYDIELAGDSNRFGFFTPTSFENKVFVGDSDMSVKDCGVDNDVKGGTLVDTDADPCF